MPNNVSEDIFRAIDALCTSTNAMIPTAVNSEEDVQQVLCAFTQVNLEAMGDVLLLARNRRGTGAMKVARSMFEVALMAEYLEKNPQESIDYQEFAHMLVWRWLQTTPDKLTPEQRLQAETEFNRVKSRFTSTKGRIQNNWSAKTLKQIAEEIGRADLYEGIYGPASSLHHVNVLGLLGHELDWVAEGLRVAHGSLLQTACSFYNSSDRVRRITNFSELTEEFGRVWQKHVAER